jgi:hypothetical protein
MQHSRRQGKMPVALMGLLGYLPILGTLLFER